MAQVSRRRQSLECNEKTQTVGCTNVLASLAVGFAARQTTRFFMNWYQVKNMN